MNTHLITTWEHLFAIETDWNALADGIPLRSWDWLATWWKHYGSGERQLYVLAVYDDASQLIGVAPWYLDRTIVHGNVVRWLGSGEVCTDHLSLICASEHRDTVAEQIADSLTASFDDWDRLDLGAVDGDDTTMACLFAKLAERECIVSSHPADACWAVDLPPSWDDYLAALSKSHRKQLRQLERRVLDAERTCWHQLQSPANFSHAWEVLVDLHQRRRKSLGEPGCFASRPFHDFHYELAGRLLQRNQLRMSWMEMDGAPAAAEYHFSSRNTTFAYQGGVDPDRLQEEPGRLSTILCLRAAIAEGHTRFDFMRGDEPYKAHWRATPRPTFDYRVVPNRRLARLRGRVLTLTNVVSDWVRQSMPVVAD